MLEKIQGTNVAASVTKTLLAGDEGESRRSMKEKQRDQRRAERTKRQRLYYSTITGLITFMLELLFVNWI